MPAREELRADLSYLGTYAADRQQALNALFIKAARQLPERRFAIAGAQYPTEFSLCALPREGLSFLLFQVRRPEFFDAVVTDEEGRVQAVQVKQANAQSHWIGAISRRPAQFSTICTGSGWRAENRTSISER